MTTATLPNRPAPRYGDDLFGDAPAATRTTTARIICAVCRAVTSQPLTHAARLCAACSAQPERTRADVCTVRDAARARLQDTLEAFDEDVATEPTDVRAWWKKVEAARAGGAANFHAAWAKALIRDDACGALARRYVSAEAVADACNAQFEWADRALGELRALEELR